MNQQLLEQAEVEKEIAINQAKADARTEAQQAVAQHRKEFEKVKAELMSKHCEEIQEIQANLRKDMDQKLGQLNENKKSLQEQRQALKAGVGMDQVVADELKAKACQNLKRALQRQMHQGKALAVQIWRSSQIHEMLEDYNAAEEDMIDTMSQQSTKINTLEKQLTAEQETNTQLRKRIDALTTECATQGTRQKSEDLTKIAELEDQVNRLKAELQAAHNKSGTEDKASIKDLLVVATDDGAKESQQEVADAQEHLKMELEQETYCPNYGLHLNPC